MLMSEVCSLHMSIKLRVCDKACTCSISKLTLCSSEVCLYNRGRHVAGLGQEDSGMIIEGMAQQGAEPTYCMGDDIPLAVLSDKPHMLYNYFKQRFAQVTNPPIDPLREGLVMSMTMRLGKRGNLLQPGPDAYSQVGFWRAVAKVRLSNVRWSLKCNRPNHL